MLHRIQRALSRTLARQMVFALTLFLSITLSLFSWEMMRRQQVRQARQQPSLRPRSCAQSAYGFGRCVTMTFADDTMSLTANDRPSGNSAASRCSAI